MVPPFPQLLSLAQLDQRIAANNDSKHREHLELQRHLLLDELTGHIYAGDSSGLVQAPPADRLRELRAAVERARGDGDVEQEMIATLKLNTAVLDAALAHLLGSLAKQWATFAPRHNFDHAFSVFRQQTAFDQGPFERAVARIEAEPSSKPTATDRALTAVYHTYQLRESVYATLITALQDEMCTAASDDQLLRWLGVGHLIAAVNGLPGVADINTTLFASGQLTLGQVTIAVAVFLVLSGFGLLAVPSFVRLLGRLLSHPQASESDLGRLTRLWLHAFNGPLRALVLLFALGMSGRILLLRVPATEAVTVLSILVVLVLVWGLLRLIDAFLMEYSEHLHQRYPNLRGELVNFIANLVRILVLIITALYLLQDLGYNITTLLASLGIGGLAVAFAAKDTIANIFGSMSIIADDMFRQGDWIVTPDANGTVIDIGMRSTKIRTFDNAIIFVPNAYLAGISVRNWSRRKLGRRILLTVGLEYGSDMAMVRKTVDDIRTMLAKHPDIADSTTDTSQYTKQQLTRIANAMDSYGVMQTLLVYLDELGESSINIMVYCFSKSVVWEKWLQAKQDVIFRCCDIVTNNGLNIAFPSRTLYLREDADHREPQPNPAADE